MTFIDLLGHRMIEDGRIISVDFLLVVNNGSSFEWVNFRNNLLDGATMPRTDQRPKHRSCRPKHMRNA